MTPVASGTSDFFHVSQTSTHPVCPSTSQAPHLRDQGFHFLGPFNVFQYTPSVGYYTDHAFLIIVGQSINIQKPEKGRVVSEKLKGTIAKVIVQT